MVRLKTTVYLAGAIDHVGSFATVWRKDAGFKLQQFEYNVYDPTAIPEHEYMSPEEIAQKNIFMQERSDLLLVEYILENRPYIGTDFEMAWAKMHNQPIIVICPNDNKNRIYMKYMATKIVPTLDEAVDYIITHYPA